MKTIKYVGLLAVVACLLASAAASAGTITCSSITVTHLWIFTDSVGSLAATVTAPASGSDPGVPQATWVLCDLKTAVGNVTPEMCQEVYTQLVVAKVTGATLVVAFSDAIKKADGTPVQTCADVPSWKVSETGGNLSYVRVNP